MSFRPLQTIFQQMCRTRYPCPGEGTSDAGLLERFLKQEDEGAFELLVWRHGPMVLGVCRRLLQYEEDVEDAFQAAFFTLARKAGSIGKRDSVGSWLYKVAYRIALRARARALKRAGRERPLGEFEPPGTSGPDDLAWRELRPVLDAEINRLPEKYRVAFVLCCLEGKTNEEAAAQLGCPKGTILSRLSRARERLRVRLLDRGVALAAAPLALLLARHLAPLAKVSPVLATATAHAALLLSLGRMLGEAARASAVRLADEMLHELWRGRARRAGLVLIVFALLGGAGAAVASTMPDDEAAPAGTPCHAASPAGEPNRNNGAH